MMRRLGLATAVAASLTAGSARAEVRLLDWADLHGWDREDHAAALQVFRETCRDMTEGDWPALCALSEKGEARTFFETFFRPLLITDGDDPLFTGYYEPELLGSRTRTPRFGVPLYRVPDDIPEGTPWLSREDIQTSGALENRDLEIVWVEDPVDKFFLQIQGSGRIKLAEDGDMRVGYGGKNGHPYRSIGQELVRRGVFDEHEVSAQVIRKWVHDHPEEGEALLNFNPSYVFFREVTQVPPERGPLGAMNRSITPGRSIAVDPEVIPLGAPVWVEKDGAAPLRRLMIAQDTGAAIKGAQRADIFYGTGEDAGREAGRVRDRGRMVVLLPIDEALRVLDRTP